MIIRQFISTSLAKALISLLMTAQLVACGGDDGSDAAPASGVSTPRTASSSSVSGTPQAVSGSAVGSRQAVSGSATISWTAPVARADGSPLSLADIEGFRVYYGTSEGNYPNHIDVVDATAVQLTLNQLPIGTYYIVMTTYDVTGRESAFSPVLIKTI